MNQQQPHDLLTLDGIDPADVRTLVLDAEEAAIVHPAAMQVPTNQSRLPSKRANTEGHGQ